MKILLIFMAQVQALARLTESPSGTKDVHHEAMEKFFISLVDVPYFRWTIGSSRDARGPH